MNIYYIDPQSYNNLSHYDYFLLSNVKGHKITYYYSDQYQLDKFPADERRCRFHYNGKKTTIAKALSYVWSILRLIKDVLLERPNIVHIQWIRLWHIDYFFAWLLVHLGIRVIFTAHNILPHVQRPGDEKHFCKYYHMVNDIIVHTSRTKEELIEQMGVNADKIHVIYHGVFESEISKEDVDIRCEELRNLLHLSDNDVVFSCLGVQKSYKGTDSVIQVWAGTPELCYNPNARLLIIGRKHDVDYTPVQNLTNVYILDEMISDLDFEAYLQLSSVVLLPYKRISQSGLLFSAVCRYTPILITDVGGLAEPLKYGHIGWNIRKPDEEALQREMIRLSKAKTEVDTMREAKSQFDNVKVMYSWEKIGASTAALYSGIWKDI